MMILMLMMMMMMMNPGDEDSESSPGCCRIMGEKAEEVGRRQEDEKVFC